MLQHLPNLLLICIAITGNRLLYFFRRIFRYRQTRTHGSGNSHALRSSQFEHTLHILPKKRRFDGKLVGTEFFDKRYHLLMYQLQTGIIVFLTGQLKHIHLYQLNGAAIDGNNAMPHYKGAGVNTKDYFNRLMQTGCIFTKLPGPRFAEATRRQSRYIVMKLNKSIKIFFNYFLGPVLFAWVTWSIYNQIQKQPNLETSWQRIRESFRGPMVVNLVLVVLLMVVNWGIEAVKWKLSVQRIQQVSFFTSFKAILSGTSFSVTTPNRVGEYLGRVLYMNEGNRLKAISLTIACSMSQLIITLFMGWIGIILLRNRVESSHLLSGIWVQMLIYGVFFTLLILTVFYFRLSVIIRLVEKLPRVNKYAWLIKGLDDFNATLMLQLLSLSAVRFLVFIIQYYLLFRLFGVDVSLWQGLWAVSVSFLVMAVIPTIALFTDLSLRGQVSLKLLGLFSSNNLGISLASVSIWFINLIIPALTGSLLILGIKKIFKNNNHNEEGSKT